MNESDTKTSLPPAISALIVACLAVGAVLAIGPAIGISDQLNAILSLVAGLVFMVLHGSYALGARRLAVFVVITVLVSFVAEAVGVATGLIFGRYYYTDLLGPKLLGVPLMIQVGYVSMGYASLMTARIILGAFDTAKSWGIVGVALCGAMLMVGWDVSMDPYQSTISGDWIWQDGGGYFGVPLHNYAGWFGTVFLFMLVYLAWESRNPLPPTQEARRSRAFWSGPVFYYFFMALSIALTPWVDDIKFPIASPQNYTGSLESLQQSLTLVCIFVMGTPVAIAFVRLLRA